MGLLALVFMVLIVYGSLYPFADWVTPAGPLFAFLAMMPGHVEKADLVQNVLAYMPFGLFVGAALMPARRSRHGATGATVAAMIVAVLAGAALSLAMESIQQFLPSRDPSLVDLLLNIGGTGVGALLAAMVRDHEAPGARLLALRSTILASGHLPNLMLAALALWALSQTSPLVPTFDPGKLRASLALLARAVRQPDSVMPLMALNYALALLGLGLMARLLVRAEHAALAWFAGLVGVVLALKIVVEGRQLSPEALGGAAAAMACLALWRGGSPRAWAWGALAVLGSGFVVGELAPAPGGGQVHPFNWIPLAGQMQSLNGLQNILELIWPFFAMACMARFLCAPRRRAALALAGAVAVALLVFVLEWLQQDMGGRVGDITQVMLACGGWIWPWCVRGADFAPGSTPGGATHGRATHGGATHGGAAPP